MRTKRRRFWILSSIGFCATLAAFMPVVEHLPHSETAILQFEEGLKPPVSLRVVWYDLRLNTNYFSQSVEFIANGQAKVPDPRVRTQLWRLALKKVLSPFDKWTVCEHCAGPWVDYHLKLNDGFETPENLRLAQNRTKAGATLIFRVSLIADESKFEPRDFRIQSHSDLVYEAAKLIAKGPAPNIPRSSYGPELLAIDPVRAECRDSALILWMGGKMGYAIVPNSTACPAMNRIWITGTEHAHVFKLEKM